MPLGHFRILASILASLPLASGRGAITGIKHGLTARTEFLDRMNRIYRMGISGITAALFDHRSTLQCWVHERQRPMSRQGRKIIHPKKMGTASQIIL
jgi:hypothetical protein